MLASTDGAWGHRPMAAALLVALALLGLGAAAAGAICLDARRMAMGGASPPRPDNLCADNPAYTVVPDRGGEGGWVLPIPLGLLDLAGNTSKLDPDDDDFDPLYIANLLANPPLHLELKDPDPLDGDLTLDLGQDHLRLYWEDADLLIPEEPLDFGSRWERLGISVGGRFRDRLAWRVQATPYLDGRVETTFDDALYGVLAEGDSLKPNSRYGLDGEGRAAVAISWKFLLAGQLPSARETEVYVAAAPKLLTAFGMADAQVELVAVTGDTLFSSDSLDVEPEVLTRYTDGVAMGYGFGLDLGVAVRHGPWDLGVGVRDIGASIHFSETKLERQYLEEDGDDGDMVTEVLEEGAEHDYELDAIWTLNAAYSSEDWFVAGDLRFRPWGNELHLGGEYRLGPWALRAGTYRDRRDEWQFSGGGGYSFRRLSVDLALETHKRYFQDERGLALGLSLRLR